MLENRRLKGILAATTLSIIVAAAFPKHPLWAVDTGEQGQDQPKSSDSMGQRLTMIQGRVTDVSENQLTVRTPNIYPPRGPHGITPHYIILGKTFLVDISGAEYESTSGNHTSKQTFAVGDFIVAAGREVKRPPDPTVFVPAALLKASVIERSINSTPATATATR